MEAYYVPIIKLFGRKLPLLKVLAWLAIQNELLSIENLNKKNVNMNQLCVFDVPKKRKFVLLLCSLIIIRESVFLLEQSSFW